MVWSNLFVGNKNRFAHDRIRLATSDNIELQCGELQVGTTQTRVTCQWGPCEYVIRETGNTNDLLCRLKLTGLADSTIVQSSLNGVLRAPQGNSAGYVQHSDSITHQYEPSNIVYNQAVDVACVKYENEHIAVVCTSTTDTKWYVRCRYTVL